MLDPVFFLQQSASPPRCISRGSPPRQGKKWLPAGVTLPGDAGLGWGYPPPRVGQSCLGWSSSVPAKGLGWLRLSGTK